MTRPFEAELVPPACEPTVERLQRVLDGDLSPDALDADPHPAVCPTCRDRIRAARLVLTALAEPADPFQLPHGLTDAILLGVRADRRKAARRRVLFAVSGLAVAAAVVLAVWWSGGPRPVDSSDQPGMAKTPPTPTAPEFAPEPRPIRINDEIAKAGGALRDSSRTITEPATSGPKVFASVTNALTKFPVNSVVADLEPARRSLAEIPVAAKTGLEPVTDSAQRALHRLLRDVGAVSPGKPKL
jgi:hypothetical protein